MAAPARLLSRTRGDCAPTSRDVSDTTQKTSTFPELGFSHQVRFGRRRRSDVTLILRKRLDDRCQFVFCTKSLKSLASALAPEPRPLIEVGSLESGRFLVGVQGLEPWTR
jgi:hypothetical protein